MLRIEGFPKIITHVSFEEELRKRTGVSRGKITLEDFRKIKYINFQYCKPNDDIFFELLPFCTEIVAIDLDLSEIENVNLSFLRTLSKISRLQLILSGEVDISIIGELLSLQELILLNDGCDECNLTNIEVIGQLIRLKSLTLVSAGAIDLAFLQKLKKLKRLELVEAGPLSNVDVLGKLRFRQLGIFDCVLWNASFLKQLKKCMIGFANNIVIHNTGLEILGLLDPEYRSGIYGNWTQDAESLHVEGVHEISPNSLKRLIQDEGEFWFPEYVELVRNMKEQR